MSLRIVFMGTPDFAVESLKCLLEAGQNVVGVITAPDKPAGRGKKIRMSPVKSYALEAGISSILQPTNLKDPGFLEELQALRADIQIVVAFRMLPEIVWQMPPKGTVNLHASLLPNYRGAAPINWAIINGEKETGITTFFIEKEIDTGKILFREEVAITDDMDAGMLHDQLMELGGKLIVNTVNAIEKGDYQAIPQSNIKGQQKAAPKIFKEDCKINWERSAQEIINFIRGLSPYPAAWTIISDGSKEFSVKLFKCHIESNAQNFTPGQHTTDGKTYLKIATNDDLIAIDELQLAGKKRMNTSDFLRGFQKIETLRLA